MSDKLTGDGAIDACKKIMKIKKMNYKPDTLEHKMTNLYKRGRNDQLWQVRDIIESHQVDDTAEKPEPYDGNTCETMTNFDDTPDNTAKLKKFIRWVLNEGYSMGRYTISQKAKELGITDILEEK